MSVWTEMSRPPRLASGMIDPLASAKSAGVKLITEASGTGVLYGKIRRSPPSVAWTTVIFRDAALAVEGAPQPLTLMTGKLRIVLAASEGPPVGPTALRVSIKRQGVSG